MYSYFICVLSVVLLELCTYLNVLTACRVAIKDCELTVPWKVPTPVVRVVFDVSGHFVDAPFIIHLTATPQWTVATSRKCLTLFAALVYPFV